MENIGKSLNKWMIISIVSSVLLIADIAMCFFANFPGFTILAFFLIPWTVLLFLEAIVLVYKISKPFCLTL